ncbi:MAG: hypothetical protein PHD70_04675 [Anaerostipes sp.]|jgi:hypothetical protein|nr:hypothetical protein [Anaerostipes sp.]
MFIDVNVIYTDELDENSVTRIFRVTANDGKEYDTKHFNLKPEDIRKFLENVFCDGEIKTAGTNIDKLKVFFEKYFGIGGAVTFAEPKEHKVL